MTTFSISPGSLTDAVGGEDETRQQKQVFIICTRVVSLESDGTGLAEPLRDLSNGKSNIYSF